MALRAFRSIQQPVMVKRIVVPTDFSAASGGALAYARHLAAQLEAKVVVVHVYHPSFDLNNPYLDVPVNDFGRVKQEALENFLQEFDERAPQEAPPVFSPQTEILVGFAGEEIVQYAADGDMIVMGTTGSGKKGLEKVFGSVSSHVAQHAHTPVLLVPADAGYRKVRKVMYASNHESADEALLNKALSESGIRPEVIHFVHADRREGVECRIAEVRYEQLVENAASGVPMQFVELDCEHISEGLYRYAQEQDVDLIVMGTVHRNFLQRLFHRSVTRQMISHSDIPLLIMHF